MITNLSYIIIFCICFSDLNKGLNASNFNKNGIINTSSGKYQEITKPLKSVEAFSSKSIPVARQSWGKNTDVKEGSGDRNDQVNRSLGDADDVNDDDGDAKSLSDDDNNVSFEQRNGANSGVSTGIRSKNQLDEEEEEVRDLHRDRTELVLLVYYFSLSAS